MPILFVVNFKEGVIARAWLNDLPIHKEFVHGPDSMTGGANHWLVPGMNTLEIEVLRAPLDKGSVVDMMLYTVRNEHSVPPDLDVHCRIDFPALWRDTPENERILPYRIKAAFAIPNEVQEPVYWGAPPLSFGCSGTPELWEAVQAVHDAIANHDVERFIQLTSLKDEEYERAYPGIPSAEAKRVRESARKFFALHPRVKPLDRNVVHFEPRAGGRVAYVSGADGEPVIHSIAERDPGLHLRANLLLTQVDGRWRIFG